MSRSSCTGSKAHSECDAATRTRKITAAHTLTCESNSTTTAPLLGSCSSVLLLTTAAALPEMQRA